jgi:hypothetical protein
MKPGELFITTSSWDAIHMWKNPYGIWVPKQKDHDKNIIAAAPYSVLVRSTLTPDTPAMYVGTDGRPHVGVFLVADTICELPYNILKPIKD